MRKIRSCKDLSPVTFSVLITVSPYSLTHVKSQVFSTKKYRVHKIPESSSGRSLYRWKILKVDVYDPGNDDVY